MSGRVGLRAVAVLAFAAAAAAPALPQTTPSSPPDGRILVMPFDNVPRDDRVFWLREGAAILVADDVNTLGASAIAREERRQAFDRLQVPPAASLTDATVIRIGQLVRAAEVVVGSIQLEANDVLAIHVRTIALESGRMRIDVVERAPLGDLFALVERVARRIAPASSASSEEVKRQHPPVAAFENYVKGLLAETPSTAVTFLEAALKQYPAYDRARLAEWEVYADEGDHQRALAAVDRVPRTSTWSRRARFLAGLSQLQLRKLDDAFATFKALADAQPTAPVLNNLGVVQTRRAAGLPTYYFNRAAEADPDDPDYFFNLGYAYWLAHDAQAAIYWLRETVRRDPADGDAHFVLGVALGAAGNAVESAREKELARRLSSTYAQWEKRPAGDLIPKGLERVKSGVELPHSRQVDATLTTAEQRDQRELARFYLDRARRLFEEENDREAVLQLDRALFLSPYDAEAHLLLGRIHLRNGRTREAIDALKISLWSAETARGHLALGHAYVQAKDLDAARAEAERALALEPGSAEARALIEEAGGRSAPPRAPDRRGTAC